MEARSHDSERLLRYRGPPGWCVPRTIPSEIGAGRGMVDLPIALHSTRRAGHHNALDKAAPHPGCNVSTRMPLSYALVTPSFRLDVDRCALLVRTAERWISPHVTHYLIVDHRDLALFRPLASGRTRLLVVEDIVPWWIRRIPGVRRFWWSWRSKPIKNWILQQIVKLSVPDVVSEDVLLYVDSDVFFTRPFDPREAERDGKVPLFVETGQTGMVPHNDPWHAVAAKMLGIPVEQTYDTNFIGNVICWRRSNVPKLRDRIARTANCDWQLALSTQDKFSEYILYGLYAQRVLGSDSGHYDDSLERTLTYWNRPPLSLRELSELRGQLKPHHHSVMISSKSCTPVEDIRRTFLVDESNPGMSSP